VRQDYMKLLLCDEAGVFAAACPDLPQGMVMCRSHNAGYVLAFQNLGQLGALRPTIWDACGTKLMLGGTPWASGEVFSKELGAREYPYVTRTTTTTTGRTAGTSNRAPGYWAGAGSSGGSGRSHAGSAAASVGASELRRLRATWLPAELQDLPPFHAVVAVTRYRPDPSHPADPAAGARDSALINLRQEDLAPWRAHQAAVAARVAGLCAASRPTPVRPRDGGAAREARAELRAAALRLAALEAGAGVSPQGALERDALARRVAALEAWYRYYRDGRAQARREAEALTVAAQAAEAVARQAAPAEGSAAPAEPTALARPDEIRSVDIAPAPHKSRRRTVGGTAVPASATPSRGGRATTLGEGE
jgi:hypothetical protein